MSSDADKSEKTEKPTPKRLNRLRKEGSVPQSSDVASLVTLFAGATALFMFFGQMGNQLTVYFLRTLSFQDLSDPGKAMEALASAFVLSITPMVVVAGLAGLIAGMAQTRLLFTLKPLQPNFNKLKPNFKKVLPSKNSMAELAKSMAKMTALGVVVVSLLSSTLPTFAGLTAVPVDQAAIEVGWAAAKLALYVFPCLFVIAAADLWWSNWKFIDDNMMTKQEVKDERRQADGDPKIKAKMRARQREIAYGAALNSVEDATVLVTNPTHISIALRYDVNSDDPPIVTGKGEEALALKMRERAREHSVPIVENRPLARALNATVEQGQPIPLDLYQAVAEVIAHVLQIGGEAPAA